MEKILPIYQEDGFLFSEDDKPEHIERLPTAIPNFIGLFTVFNVVNADKRFMLAVDIPTEDLARIIANARIKYQEQTLKTYGYDDDVYIGFAVGTPEQQEERVHIGRSL